MIGQMFTLNGQTFAQQGIDLVEDLQSWSNFLLVDQLIAQIADQLIAECRSFDRMSESFTI